MAVAAVSLSVGAILWGGLGVDRSLASLAAIGVATLLTVAAARTRREAHDAEARRRLAALAAQVAALDQRMDALAGRLDQAEGRAAETGRMTARAVADELGTLGTLVRDLAEAVAQHEAELDAARQPGAGRGASTAASPAAVPARTQVVAERGPLPTASPAAPATILGGRVGPAAAQAVPASAPVEIVVRAIASERLSLFLQPVVGLADRRVQLYEVLARVARPAGAGHVEPAEIAAVAARHGLLARYDTLLVREAYRIARHLRARDRDIPLLVTISIGSLADPGFYALVSATLAEEPALATAVALQVAQASWNAAQALEVESIEALRALGVGFVLDDVRDLRLAPEDLVRRGVRKVRAAASVLVAARDGGVPSDIHPLDVPGLLARHGVETIVTEVGTERDLVELFEFGLALAQGALFSGPRPVRPEVLAGAPPAPLPASTTAGAQPSAAASTQVERAEPAPQRASLRSVLRRSGA